MKTIIEAAFYAGYEPSQDGLTGEALYREALAYLTRLY